MHLGWEAVLQPFWNRWIWVNPPKDDGQTVQVIDGDITGAQPLVVDDGLIRITHDLWTGLLTHTEVNPASVDSDIFPSPQIVRNGQPEMNYIEGGIWIIAPNYRGMHFDTSAVVNAKDFLV